MLEGSIDEFENYFYRVIFYEINAFSSPLRRSYLYLKCEILHQFVSRHIYAYVNLNIIVLPPNNNRMGPSRRNGTKDLIITSIVERFLFVRLNLFTDKS